MAPTGYVTFLFTDIQGSTKLAQNYASEYNDLLAKHNTILQETFESNNGYVFKKIGDAFCSAFQNAADAANAAIETQKKLAAEFSGNIELKVRMGIHSGEAEFVDNDYIGYVSLSRVNRIMSAAQGGQILISQIVHDSIMHNEKLKLTFKDFGKRRLKDIIIPEHIYQIISEGLITDFAPLKSLDARQNNLPSSLSKFIGRRKEIEEIKKLFSNLRLISLTGMGGTGKTRLAIQLVSEMIDEFENGVWIIEFSPITDPDLIVKEISKILNLKEEPEKDDLEILKEYLKDKNILLIFDNCEHLLERCASITEILLSFCPKLKIISTSREPFNIQGEIIYKIPPLSMPEKIRNKSFEDLSEFESVKLFLERANSVNANFQLSHDNIYDVAELCKKLDGIPLAIELAAKRINVLPVDKILARLDDRFKLLTGGSSTALPRQKTLKALIDWSYDMLNPNEQLLLQRLSVFMGGWNLEASEEICSDDNIDQYEVLDLVNSLHDKSLITFNECDGMGRYGMLESIKFYAQEKLTDREELMRKHFEYFLNVSSVTKQKEKGLDQLQWLKLVDDELDNIRKDIQWAFGNSPEDAYRLEINVFDFWYNKGYLKEGFESLMKVKNSLDISDKKLRADLLFRIARFCYELGKFEELEKYSKEALELYREINDKEGILKSINTLGLKLYTEMDYAGTIKLNEEALALSNEINSKEGKANSLYNLSFPVSNLGDFERSVSLKEEALKLAKEIRNDHLTAHILLSLSVSHAKKIIDIKKSSLYSEESLKISRNLDDKYLISVNLVNLADLKLHFEEKNYEEAEYLLLDAYKISKECGYFMNISPIRKNLGGLYVEKGQLIKAKVIYKEFLNEKDNPGSEFFINDVIAGFGRIFLKSEQYEQATIMFGCIDTAWQTPKKKSANANSKLHEQERNILINGLGEEKFGQLWSEGKAMTLDDAVEFCKNVQ
ncbi:MAG TPA: adenylate/guanylate cyclase domain-containing protein [Ignavibacteria bacterium]|nr:adenylate/guanylate cyclase domain-containing protein [Ignavibacteria bacterium]HMR40788.1 adenylate/guanylate cyclase domain-containing protein [Ignavibacteria bacterium]